MYVTLVSRVTPTLQDTIGVTKKHTELEIVGTSRQTNSNEQTTSRLQLISDNDTISLFICQVSICSYFTVFRVLNSISSHQKNTTHFLTLTFSFYLGAVAKITTTGG